MSLEVRIAQIEVNLPREDTPRGNLSRRESNGLATLAAVKAVLDLHQPFEWSFGYGPVTSCTHCKDMGASEEQSEYPCPTVRAVATVIGAPK